MKTNIAARILPIVVAVVAILGTATIYGGPWYAELDRTTQKLKLSQNPDHHVNLNGSLCDIPGSGTGECTVTTTGGGGGGDGTIRATSPVYMTTGTATATTSSAAISEIPNLHVDVGTSTGQVAAGDDSRFGKVSAASGDGLDWLNQKVTADDGLYVSTVGAPPSQSVKVSMQAPLLSPVKYVFAPGLQDFLGTFTYLGSGIYERNVNGAIEGTSYIEDGITVSVYDRIGVFAMSNEGPSSPGRPQNGVYDVLVAGDSTHKFKMQRASDLDAIGDFKDGLSLYVTSGALYGGARVQFVATGAATLDTDNLHFLYFVKTVDSEQIYMVPDSTVGVFSDAAPGWCPQYTHEMGKTKVLTEDGWGQIAQNSVAWDSTEGPNVMSTVDHPGLLKTLPTPAGKLLGDTNEWVDPSVSVDSSRGYWTYNTTTTTGTGTDTGTATTTTTGTTAKIGSQPTLTLTSVATADVAGGMNWKQGYSLDFTSLSNVGISANGAITIDNRPWYVVNYANATTFGTNPNGTGLFIRCNTTNSRDISSTQTSPGIGATLANLMGYSPSVEAFATRVRIWVHAEWENSMTVATEHATVMVGYSQHTTGQVSTLAWRIRSWSGYQSGALFYQHRQVISLTNGQGDESRVWDSQTPQPATVYNVHMFDWDLVSMTVSSYYGVYSGGYPSISSMYWGGKVTAGTSNGYLVSSTGLVYIDASYPFLFFGAAADGSTSGNANIVVHRFMIQYLSI